MHIRRAGRELPEEAPERPGRIAEVDEAIERRALGDWVWTALEDLPQDLRVTVMLRYFTSTCSYGAIAATLGVPVGTVRSRLNQAKAKLADALLHTASTAHTEHTRLVEQRTREWEGDSRRDPHCGTGDALQHRPRTRRARRSSIPRLP